MLPFKRLLFFGTFTFLLLYFFSFSSCFLEDYILVDKYMEFQARVSKGQSSFINQKGVFKDVFVITKEDLFDIFKEDIPDSAEIIDVDISFLLVYIKTEQVTNQTTLIDVYLTFNNADVFITKDFSLGNDPSNIDIIINEDEFLPGRGNREATIYLEDLLKGTNKDPLNLDMYVYTHNPGVPDPFTSLDLELDLSLTIKYRVCSKVLVGTEAEDCEKK